MNSKTNNQTQKQKDSAKRISELNTEELRNVVAYYYRAKGADSGYTRAECRELIRAGEIIIPAGFLKKYAEKDPEECKEKQQRKQTKKATPKKEQPEKEETTEVVEPKKQKKQSGDCFNFYNCTVQIYQGESSKVIRVEMSTQTDAQEQAHT